MRSSQAAYTPIDRWSHMQPGAADASRLQTLMNDGARRIYAARQRAQSRSRLTPWWPDADADLCCVNAIALPALDRRALPAPGASQSRWVH